MKVKIGERLINPCTEPFAIIFDKPEEVKHWANYLLEAIALNPSMRVYVAGPEESDLKEFVKDYIHE